MARPPVGTRSQDRSLAAVAAFLASRLAGVKADDRTRWLGEARLAIGRNGLERAATYVGTAWRPWLIVDEPALNLGLEKAVVVFPGSGRARPDLLETLRGTGAVRQFLVMRSRRDVIAVLVFPRVDKDALFTTIESTDEPFVWEELLEDDRVVEADMWRALMHKAARREALVQSPAHRDM
jgi:hypothetical protein